MSIWGVLGTTAIGVRVAVRALDLAAALPVVNAFNDARLNEPSDTEDSEIEDGDAPELDVGEPS